MTQTIVLASNNAGKLKEFGELLAPLGFVLKPQREFDIPEAEEPHPTFVENALAKARHAARLTGLPALADDSGICAIALQGAPGVHVGALCRRAESRIRATMQSWLPTLAQHDDKRVYYYCALVYVRHADDPQPVIAEGRWDGEVIAVPRGEGGFGYDPYFLVPALGKTAAELGAEDKNRLSHRGQAMRLLAEKLR